MDLRQLQYLVAVAEEGSVRRAARRLYMAQPPLSQALLRLERDLGVELFTRTSRGVILTDAGRELVGRARDILHQVEDARSAVQATAPDDSATLRIGAVAGPLSAGELTRPILEAFRALHPDVTVRLRDTSFADQVDLVASGVIDVALVRCPVVHDDVDVIPIAAEPRALFVRSTHELASEQTLSVDDVIEYPMLGLDAPEWFSSFWQLDPERGHSLVDTQLPPVSTVQGIQLALAAAPLVVTGCATMARFAPSPLIRAIELPDASPSIIGVAYRRGDTRPVVRSFLEAAATAAAENIALLPNATSSV